MLGEPTFYRLATVFDDHSTCWMMLEHVWCSIKHFIQHHPTFLLFSCWMREILFVWPVSTTCYMRARALGLQIQPLPSTPFARVSVVWKCQRARKQRRISIKLLAKKTKTKSKKSWSPRISFSSSGDKLACLRPLVLEQYWWNNHSLVVFESIASLSSTNNTDKHGLNLPFLSAMLQTYVDVTMWCTLRNILTHNPMRLMFDQRCWMYVWYRLATP